MPVYQSPSSSIQKKVYDYTTQVYVYFIFSSFLYTNDSFVCTLFYILYF